MTRQVATILVLCAAGAPARADRMAPLASPVERALRVPVVVVGKVTAIEKATIEAPLYPGATNKVAHKIAVVKIETNLAGAAGITHLKVGFVPAGAAGIRPGRGPENPVLAEGQQWLFFLTKNPTGEFYAIPYMTPPIDAKSLDFKAQTESVAKVLAIIADPAKALKAAKAEDTLRAAIVLILKYRMLPEGTREADESKLILQALAASPWKAGTPGSTMNGLTAFFQLGLGATDGWKPRLVKPGEDSYTVIRQEFAKWLDGPGKDYRIKKLVPKK